MLVNKISTKNQLYPNLLNEISSPPKHLYFVGSIELDNPAIAIVGSRAITDYGKKVTYEITYALASYGFTIVSGLAVGVDSVAHKAALEAGGRTIAVLACGLDRIYPGINKNLAEKIISSKGALISEYEPGVPPLRQHFPARNRIITGMSIATVITEAAEKSGALISASFALEQNRSVMAVPGNIFNPKSIGTNNLLKAGATMITSVNDILNDLGYESSEPKVSKVAPATKDEATILDLIGQGINDSEDIIYKSPLNATEFSRTISLMEISGKIRSLGGGKWAKK